MALAGIDMALWDTLARSHNTSLVRLHGGVEKPLRAYGAVGYDGVSGSARVAGDWARRGFKGIKAKIGYPDLKEDLDVIPRHAIGRREDVGDHGRLHQSLLPSKRTASARAGQRGTDWVGAHAGTRL